MGTEYKKGWEKLELSLSTGSSQGQFLFQRLALPQIKFVAKRTNGEGFPVSGQGLGRLEHMDFRQRFCLVREGSVWLSVSSWALTRDIATNGLGLV